MLPHIPVPKSDRIAEILIICAVFALFIGTAQNEDAEMCKVVRRCGVPPAIHNCHITNKTDHLNHPRIEKRLGALKVCCPVYKCQDGTQRPYLFVGLGDKMHSAYSSKSRIRIGISSRRGGDVCKLTICPQKPENSNCNNETNPDSLITTFAKEMLSCCPLLKCTYSDGVVSEVEFSVLDGTLPHIRGNHDIHEICDEVTCAPIPRIRNMTCFMQQDTSSIVIGTAVGNLKECCPVWECTYHGGSSTYYYFKMQGEYFQFNEIRKMQVLRGAETNNKMSTSYNLQGQQGAGLTGGVGGNFQRKMKCETGESCPKIKKESCSFETSRPYNKYVPKEESCCPLMYCTDEKGIQRTHYVKITGDIPTNSAEIDEERGSSSASANCPKITCGNKYRMLDKCSPIPAASPFLPKIKPFASCCEIQNCSRNDGSYSQELSIRGASFSYYEISFYNIPNDGDSGYAEEFEDADSFQGFSGSQQNNWMTKNNGQVFKTSQTQMSKFSKSGDPFMFKVPPLPPIPTLNAMHNPIPQPIQTPLGQHIQNNLVQPLFG